MDAHDYDIHLLTDPDTHRHAAIHRTGPTGYTLTRIVRVPPAHPTDPAITLDPRRAPHLSAEHAVRHLNATRQRYPFYADQASGDGRILYRATTATTPSSRPNRPELRCEHSTGPGTMCRSHQPSDGDGLRPRRRLERPAWSSGHARRRPDHPDSPDAPMKVRPAPFLRASSVGDTPDKLR
jgi:hypothetical protein